MAEIDNVARAIEPAVNAVLQKAIIAVTEDAVKDAVRMFENRLRREIATTAMSVSSYYNVETRGSEVVITVRMPAAKATRVEDVDPLGR